MCGIFGILNPKPKKFDYQTYCVMGCVNDSRGGDSCGIYIDGEIEYGTGQENKFFSNYFTKSKLLEKTKECTIALGHCRKASVGGIGEAQAQPVILREKDTGKVLMVVIHNGTIYNYEALAKKYIPNVNITGMTDTQVMARIFFYKGYDVLAEYNGGSVFCIVDYRNKLENDYPTVYMWKGVSRKSEYPINAEPENERPFEFAEYKGSIYFSSIGRLFPALLRGCNVYYDMYDNTLVQFIPGEGLKLVKKYDRTKQIQSKQYNTTYGARPATTKTTGGGGSKTTTTSQKDEFSYYDGILFQTSGTNTYTRKGKKVHGKAIISTAGKFQREEGKDTRVVWFYDGIALDLEKGKQYFKFLEYLRKKSGLSQEDFVKKFENPIRLLSFDKLFFKDSILMKATSARECEIYSGPFHMIGNSSGENYKEGKRDYSNIYRDSEYSVPFTRYSKEEHEKIDLPKFREECILLMS